MRPVVVLEGLDVVGYLVEVVGQFCCGVELIAPCAVASLDGSVEFGRSWRQHVEGNVARLADGLEFGHELRAAVDLDGLDRPWHVGFDLVEEVGGISAVALR